MGVGGQRHAPAAFIPGKDPLPIVQEAGWAPGPGWIGAENLAPPGFDPGTVQLVGSRSRLPGPQFLLRTVQNTTYCEKTAEFLSDKYPGC
jgi:hypothetical protein